MKRHRMILPALLMLLLLLTGCTPDAAFDVRVQGTPEGEQAYLLLIPPDGVSLSDAAPDSMKGSELDRYAEDGFVCAGYHLADVFEMKNSQDKQALHIWFPEEEGLRSFCGTYREYRIAHCDSKGKVLHVSPSVSLCPKNKFAYAVRFVYDAGTDTAEATAWTAKTVLGSSLPEWILLMLLLTLPACALMLVVFAVMRIARRKTGMKKRACQTVSAVCSLPPLLMNILLLLERTVPYFRTDSRLLFSGSLSMVLASDLIWFAALLICGHVYYRSNP